jgi:MFS family permease
MVLSLVQVMLVLDATVVNVALPSVERDLGMSQSGLAWIVNGYALTFGRPAAARRTPADYVGRKRVFLLGLWSSRSRLRRPGSHRAVAHHHQPLPAGRRRRAGLACGVSIVTLLFTDDRERTRALSIWGGLAGIGGTLGVLLSGVLSDLASLAVGVLHQPADRGRRPRGGSAAGAGEPSRLPRPPRRPGCRTDHRRSLA